MNKNGVFRSEEQKKTLALYAERHGLKEADAERMARCTNAAIDRIKFLMEHGCGQVAKQK